MIFVFGVKEFVLGCIQLVLGCCISTVWAVVSLGVGYSKAATDLCAVGWKYCLPNDLGYLLWGHQSSF